jgi:tellurite methyltransferase
MSDADRQRWNLRYSSGTADMAPNCWLVEHEALIRPRQAGQRALDLACGMGQNALYLARLGYQVDAWDISDVALEGLRAALAVAGEGLAVTLRQVDLDVAAISPATYDLVLDLNFLERRLFGEMAAALRPGGILMLRALMHRAVGDERTPPYLLEPGELAAAFGPARDTRVRGGPGRRLGGDGRAVYDSAWRGGTNVALPSEACSSS